MEQKRKYILKQRNCYFWWELGFRRKIALAHDLGYYLKMVFVSFGTRLHFGSEGKYKKDGRLLFPTNFNYTTKP